MAEPQTTLEKLQALTPKVDSAERLAYFRQFDKKYYADAEFLNLIRQAAIELLTTGGSGIVQDNLDIRKTLTATTSNINSVVFAINRLEPYYITETQSLWYIVSVISPGGLSTYKYKLLNKGKGVYGLNQAQIKAIDLELMYVNIPITEDVEADPATEIIPFVLFLDWNVWEWLNEQADPIIIQPQNEGYTLFQGRVDGQDESYLFIGAAGTYGIGGLVATQADFQLLNKEMTPAVQSITGYGIDNTDATNPRIKDIRDLPHDLFIATQNNNSTRLYYETDSIRELDLQPLVSVNIMHTNEILRDEQQPNNIVVIGNFVDINTPAIIITMKNCKIIDNVLVPGNVSSAMLPNYRIHGSVIHRGQVYCLNRPTASSGLPSTITKINPYNYSQVKSFTFPATTAYIGAATDLIAYKNKLYTLFGLGGSNFSYFIEIDENLNNQKVLFTAGNITSQKRTSAQSPFLIYNDEIYIPIYNNQTASIAYNTMGVCVYDFKGSIKREITNQPLTTGGSQIPSAHWMGIFDGKLIITNAQGVNNMHREITRWDCETLELEQVKQLDFIVTDDNSIMSNGDLYINGEAAPDGSTSKLLTGKFYDFNTITTKVNNYISGGSLNPRTYNDTFKKDLSSFNDDLPFKTLNGESLKGTGNIVVSGNADTKLDLAGGTMSGVLNTVGILPVTHNAYSLGNSSLLFTSIWTNIVNANNYRPRATGININFQSFAGVNHTIVSDAGRWNFGTASPDTNMKVGIEGNAKLSGTFTFGQLTTGTAPAYVRGASYFNTTLSKLMIGGVSAWETVQSS